ncbi:hypothetical protein D3C83_212220 [compost metagenome]
MPDGREAEIEQVVATLREASVTTIAVWSYLACEAMSRLAAADTEATWDAVERAFALAREAGSQRGGGR